MVLNKNYNKELAKQSKLVNNVVDSFHKCSQFIGQLNNLRSIYVVYTFTA